MTQIAFEWPAKTIVNGMCSDSMALAASKVIRHQSCDHELFGPSTTITALSKDIHIVRGATATVIGLEAAICGTIATGADRTVTVDLHKSTGGGAYATVLSSTIGFTNASTLRTAVAAVVSASPAALVDGDILRLIVTVAGSASAQALGLIVTLTYTETYA